jgi:hypothetical protein
VFNTTQSNVILFEVAVDLLDYVWFALAAIQTILEEFYDWPEGTLFRNHFGTGPPEGPPSLRDNGGFGFVFVSKKNFLSVFMNAESTVSTFNNRTKSMHS